MDELSKVKRDLEAALRDVLQAMRIHQEGASSNTAVTIPNLQTLASVGILLWGFFVAHKCVIIIFHLPKYCRSCCSTTCRMQTAENTFEILLILIFKGAIREIPA